MPKLAALESALDDPMKKANDPTAQESIENSQDRLRKDTIKFLKKRLAEIGVDREFAGTTASLPLGRCLARSGRRWFSWIFWHLEYLIYGSQEGNESDSDPDSMLETAHLLS